MPVFTKPILSVCFFLFDHIRQSHFKFQSCLITEYPAVCFWIICGDFFLQPSQTTCGDVGAVWQFFLRFYSPRLNYFLQFSSCGPWKVFSHLNYPSHRAIGRYRHESSSRQFRNILCWLEILNNCPDGGNRHFHCSRSFLKATSINLWSSIIFCYTSYSLVFLIVMDD